MEEGGISEAARRIGVSKALIRKKFIQLKDHLGVRRLHRTIRGVGATSSGQAYFERYRTLLADPEELNAVKRCCCAESRGELSEMVPISFAEFHLSPRFPIARGAFPRSGCISTLSTAKRFTFSG